MTSLLASLPLQLVCQFIIPGSPITDRKYEVNRSPSLVHRGTLPEGYIAPGFRAALLADLPLELVCKTLLPHNTIDVIKSTPAPVILPDGYRIVRKNHAAYKVYEIPTTWNNAREQCTLEGGRLAVPDSSEKLENINSEIELPDRYLHVGIRHSISTNEWISIDTGRPVKEMPWKAGYPVDTLPGQFGDKMCAGISRDGWGLLNYSCEELYPYFVCEIPLQD